MGQQPLWADQCAGGTDQVIAIAAGGRHSVAVRRDGSITNWGDNTLGQITNIPPNLTNVVDVKAGLWHTMALRADGTVAAWGDLYIRTNPVPEGLSGVTAISAGPRHCLALKCDGTVVAWGFTFTNAGLLNNFLPTNVPSSLSNVVAISAGMEHNQALLENGNVVVWGNANNAGYFSAPLLTNILTTSAGWHYGLALSNYVTTDTNYNTLLTWGQIGDNGGRNAIVASAAGSFHVLVVRTNNEVPTIRQHPFPSVLFEPPGTATNLTVIASSSLPLMYQWQRSNSVWLDIEGETNSVLPFPNLQTTDDGRYRVRVSTDAGTNFSKNALVETLHAPIISGQSPELDLRRPQYSRAALNLEVTNQGARFLQYLWSKDGGPTPRPSAGSGYTVCFDTIADEGSYRVIVTNKAGSATSQVWQVSVSLFGEAKMWGDSTIEQRNGLSRTVTNLVSISAGGFHTLGLREDGTVIAWGRNDVGQTNVPSGLTNILAVAAGGGHSLALFENGTVRGWGQNSCGQTNVPSGLTNVTAIAAGGSQSLALRNNGSLVVWGCSPIPTNVTGVMAMSAYADHGIVLYSNGTVQVWYSGSTDLTPPAGLTNVVAVASGFDHLLALKKNGTVAAWGANDYGQTNVPAGLSNVMKIAAGGQFSIAMLNDRRVVSWGRNDYGQTNVLSGMGEAHDISAGLFHSVAIAENPGLEYPVNVAQDLLLIYNTNSIDSSNVCAYYLAHRPMVWNANVLTIDYAPQETILRADFTNVFRIPILNWLAENPTKRPKYWVLFLDVPSRIDPNTNVAEYRSPSEVLATGIPYDNSVSYELSLLPPARSPLITHINMGNTNHIGDTNACRAYIDKLANFGSNYSPGKVMISASAGGYNNSRYCFDYVLPLAGTGIGTEPLKNAMIASGVMASNILSRDLEPHISLATNVAGYSTYGIHGWHASGDYATDGTVVFIDASAWYILMTFESFNGMRFWESHGHGTYAHWFSSSAFGGSNFLNTPVGAVAHTAEPVGNNVNDPAVYFRCWAAGQSFATAAWISRRTPFFIAIGDPLIKK